MHDELMSGLLIFFIIDTDIGQDKLKKSSIKIEQEMDIDWVMSQRVI